jgi:hypothetical protein
MWFRLIPRPRVGGPRRPWRKGLTIPCVRSAAVSGLGITSQGTTGLHGRMARGGHGLHELSPGPAMPNPTTACGSLPAPLYTPRRTSMQVWGKTRQPAGYWDSCAAATSCSYLSCCSDFSGNERRRRGISWVPDDARRGKKRKS